MKSRTKVHSPWQSIGMGKDYTVRQSLIVDGNVDEMTELFDGRKFGGRHEFVLAGQALSCTVIYSRSEVEIKSSSNLLHLLCSRCESPGEAHIGNRSRNAEPEHNQK